MFKAPFILLASIIVVGIVLIIGYNNWGWFGGNKSDDKNGVFHRNGQPMNPAARAMCDESCLKAYPAGSKYEGYYYCVTGCKGGGTWSGTFRGANLSSPPSPGHHSGTSGGGGSPGGGGGGTSTAVLH